MNAACALGVGSGCSVAVQRGVTERRWSAGRPRGREVVRIQPLCRASFERQSKLNGFASTIKKLGRLPSLSKVKTQEESGAFGAKDEKAVAPKESTAQSPKAPEPEKGGWDWSWLPLTAAMANFMFGYHIGSG